MGHTAFDVISNYNAVFFVDKITGGFSARIKGNLIRREGRHPEEGRVWHTGSGRYADSSSTEPLHASRHGYDSESNHESTQNRKLFA